MFWCERALLHESYSGYGFGVLFFCQFLFFDPLRLGFAQMDHSIEDGTAYTAFDLLIGLAPRLECAADEVLIAIEERFGQRTSMIATFLFPALASFLSHRTQDFHPAPTGVLYNSHAAGLSRLCAGQ